MRNQADNLKVAAAQIAPVWLDREKTLEKVVDYIQQAGEKNIELLAFGEALVPGYPFWLDFTDAACFNSPLQKRLHSHYLEQAVQIESGHLDTVCNACEKFKVSVYLGIIERPEDRGSHSLYCSLVFIDNQGQIQSVHRKLMPTYEERLSWSTGDGHGLQVHKLGKFQVGGLNCWENWMPLTRASLYALGEDLHIAAWPGSDKNTFDITKFMAKEARSFVISASGMLRPCDIPTNIPDYEKIHSACEQTEFLANGGSAICGPDGQWLVEPQCGEEGLFYATICHQTIREERQNFDPTGHYSRPDVTQLMVNRKRQTSANFLD